MKLTKLLKWRCIGLFIVLQSCSLGSLPDQQVQPQLTFKPSPQVVEEVEVKTLEIGSEAPLFQLPGTDGKFHEISDYDDAEVLVVVFTCNHCPTAQAYEDRLISITQDYKDRGVAVVAISPNSILALLHEECGYTDLGDSFEEMKIRARSKGFNFPYLYDGDNQQVALLYGPVATPHAFVFDQQRKLRYSGRLDSSEKPGTANGEDLRSAIEAVLAGQGITEPVTKSFGCSIKWGWKVDWKKRVDREWNEAQVTLEEINESGVKTLLQNDSDKLLLVNVWATWCGPCIIEFPELLTIHRMYKGRQFEFVSLSADSPDHRPEVIRFLQKQHSAVKNYQFSKDDNYALIDAIGSEWEGALPFTLLVEPGGKVVFRHQGVIDPLELKRVIVEHPMIGRYY